MLFELRHHPSAAVVLERLSAPDIPSMNPAAAREAIRDQISRLKTWDSADVERLLTRLTELQPDATDGGEDRFLSWDDLASLAAQGLFTIGSHAMSHRPLTRISPELVDHELVCSRKVMHERLGIDVSLIAYPNGDASDEIGGRACAAGYVTAFTTRRRCVTADDQRHLLPRINIIDCGHGLRPGPTFLGRLAGLI